MTRLICFIALGVGLALSITVAASARNLSNSSTTFRDVIAEMHFEGGGGGFAITCPMTVSGSFHARTIAKVREALVGYVDRIIVNEAACRGEGRVRVETAQLPSHIRYRSFTGTLPNITEIAYRVLPPPFINEYILIGNCTFTPGAGDIMDVKLRRELGGRLVASSWAWTIPLAAGQPFGCPRTLIETGAGAPPRSAEGAAITVTLI
jgi:hypothetical protein